MIETEIKRIGGMGINDERNSERISRNHKRKFDRSRPDLDLDPVPLQRLLAKSAHNTCFCSARPPQMI